MLSQHMQNIIKAHSKGTIILHASEAIKHMDFILPPEPLRIQYDNIVSPMLNLILTLNKKNKNLRATRDILLSKLISGKIDVEDMDIGDVDDR